MTRVPNPSKVKVMSNRVMVYLNGKRGGVVLCSLEDLELVRGKAWYLDANGYAQRTTSKPSKRNISMHREILGARSGQIADHRNLNKLDNRRGNIRLVSRSLNNYNKPRNPDTGVAYHKASHKWVASLTFNKVHYYLGLHQSKESAMIARLDAEKYLVGEYRPRPKDETC